MHLISLQYMSAVTISTKLSRLVERKSKSNFKLHRSNVTVILRYYYN